VVKVIRRGAAILAVLVLAACGGGASLGDDGSGGSLGGGTGGSDSGSTTYSAGFLDGTAFNKGRIFVDAPDLSAGGQTALRVDIVDASKSRANGVSATVAFSSDCLAAGKATITPATATVTTGRIDAIYVAQGCVANDTITATVSVGDATLIVTGSVTVEAAELGTLQFVSATPSIIGMSGSAIPGQSIVAFKLVDVTGGPVANQLVTFSPSTTVGGISVTPTQNKTAADGSVQTVLTGGSTHTTVTVKATSTNPVSGLRVSGTSGQIAITTGLLDASALSVAADKYSLDGECDGDSATITVRMADRYGNPVPGGTQPTLRTEGGKINGQCTMEDPLATGSTAEAGVCTVLFVVQNPRPADGRSTILVTASGEEHFTDKNGNGYYDSGDTFVDFDLPEPFLDADEDGKWSSGEEFVDTNGNGTHDDGNIKFDGYVCSEPGKDCSSTPITVGNMKPNGAGTNHDKPFVIVFSNPSGAVKYSGKVDTTSTSTPISSSDNGLKDFTISTGALLIVDIESFRDAQGVSFPTGTTYTLSSDIGTVAEPTTVGPYNTTSGDAFSFIIKAPTTAPQNTSGLVSLKATVPASGCRGELIKTINLFKISYQ